MSTNLLALLPELILALTGVLVMLVEPLIAPGRTRKPLGWLAILGTTAAGLAALYQLHLVNAAGSITAFYGTLQVDAFSVFFHLLIASIVLVTLLASLDYFEPPCRVPARTRWASPTPASTSPWSASAPPA